MPALVNREERRERLAEATWDVIVRRGVERASLREIAAEAGMTTGAVMPYFSSRTELVGYAFARLIERAMTRVGQRLETEGLETALGELLPLDEERRRECTIWLHCISASLYDQDLAREIEHRRALSRRILQNALPERTPVEIDRLLTAVDGVAIYGLADPEHYTPEHQQTLLRQLNLSRHSSSHREAPRPSNA